MEAVTPFRGCTTLTLVLIHDLDPIRRPAKFDRQIYQSVLARGGFLVVENLLWSRLPNVDERQTFMVVGGSSRSMNAAPRPPLESQVIDSCDSSFRSEGRI